MSFRGHERAPSTGLCPTGTMPQFRTLSLAEQRLHLEAHPEHVGRVDRVALMEGALLATMQHWPTAPEVIARMLGMELSALTGKVTRAERVLLALRWPKVLRMSVLRHGGLVQPRDPPQGRPP